MPPGRACTPVARFKRPDSGLLSYEGFYSVPESSAGAGCRRKRRLRRQHFLKAAAGATRTEIVAAELLLELLAAMDYAYAALNLSLRGETPAAFARHFESGLRRTYSWHTSLNMSEIAVPGMLWDLRWGDRTESNRHDSGHSRALCR